jgi:hypothetical protein
VKKLVLTLLAAAMLSTLAAGCDLQNDNEKAKDPNSSIVDTNTPSGNTSDGSNSGTVDNNNSSSDSQSKADEGYKATFACDSHVSVRVYTTQDLSGEGEATTSAVSRDSESGLPLSDGTGQLNFVLDFDEGYVLDSMNVTGTYNKVKGSADTGVENGYRITQVSSELTITITSKQEEAEEDVTQGYKVQFEADEHVRVKVFTTQDVTGEGKETTVAYARDGGTGTLLKDGEGQVNFVLEVDEGYEVLPANIEISGGYKNLKQIDGEVKNTYRITKITSDLTITITATEVEESDKGDDSGLAESQKAQALGVTITYEKGTEDCYTVSGSTITFQNVSVNSEYSIQGTLNGNIVLDINDAYTFKLTLKGLTITSDSVCPLAILGGDEVTISAGKGTTNAIYDNRAALSDDSSDYSAALYATTDLSLQGNGSLTVTSQNNNGIHTKDDLSVKNLTLAVTCVDNALKGNDSVTINSGTLTLIATGGDGIKTSNSDISSKGNQRGTITITGGKITIYAATDAIDAAYDVVFGTSAAIDAAGAEVNIYTGKYSSYTGDIKTSSKQTLYLITKSNSASYRYAVYFYNSDTDYEWQNATYYGTVRNGFSTNYAFQVTQPAKYSNFIVFRFASSQTENSLETYSAMSSQATVNQDKNAYIISSSNSSSTLSGDWGTLTVNGSSTQTVSQKGIKADNEITVYNSTINVQAEDDGFHVNYGTSLENNLTGAGKITIKGGKISIISGDDGIHADYALVIDGGTITVTESYEGLEANLITINGGTITVKASDDGVNAAGSIVTPKVLVTGGTLDVTVPTGDVDGIDSNGDYEQTGGFVVTRDATSMNGQSASGLDIDGTCTITGGTFICAGAIGPTPSSQSQTWVMFGSSSSMGGSMWGGFGRPGGSSQSSGITFTAGTYTVKDSDGNELFSFTLSTSYSGLWISSNQFVTGKTYTISNGTTSRSWTQSSNAVSVNS